MFDSVGGKLVNQKRKLLCKAAIQHEVFAGQASPLAEGGEFGLKQVPQRNAAAGPRCHELLGMSEGV